MDLLKNFLDNLRETGPQKTTVPNKDSPVAAWKQILWFLPRAGFILFLALTINGWLDILKVPGWLNWLVLALSIIGEVFQGRLNRQDREKRKKGRRERVHARMERKRQEKEAPDDRLTYDSDGYREDDRKPR